MVLFSFFVSQLWAVCPAGGILPGDDWPDRSAEVEVQHPLVVEALQEYLFTLEGKDEDRIGVRTDGVVVLQNGEILYEEYGRGFAAHHPHLMWSVAKSINNILVGRALHEGKISSIHESICDYFERIPSQNCDVQILDLMRFTSGLNWKEIYENESNQASSTLAMLYGIGRSDMAAFVAAHDKKREPGVALSYSTGDATLLSGVLGGIYMEEDYPWSALFEPLEMNSAVFERDMAGTYVGGAYVYLTPRDAARVGQFFLQDGCWNAERLLPEGWVRASTNIAEEDHGLYFDPEDGRTGWSWWRNENVLTGELEAADVPKDAYRASGHWGQSIWVLPSWNMVLVRTGDDRDASLEHNRWIPLAMQLATPPMEEEQ